MAAESCGFGQGFERKQKVRGSSGDPELPRTVLARSCLASAAAGTGVTLALLGGGLRLAVAGQERGGGLHDLVGELPLAGSSCSAKS